MALSDLAVNALCHVDWVIVRAKPHPNPSSTGRGAFRFPVVKSRLAPNFLYPINTYILINRQILSPSAQPQGVRRMLSACARLNAWAPPSSSAAPATMMMIRASDPSKRSGEAGARSASVIRAV